MNQIDAGPSKSHPSLASEFGTSLCYAAIQEPLLGVAQVLDRATGMATEESWQFMDAPVPAEFGTPSWHFQVAGSAVGRLAPILLSEAGAKALFGDRAGVSLLTRQSSIGLSIKESAITGFIADSLFRPSHSTEDLFTSRLKQGTMGAIGFSAMTAGSLGLESLAGSRVLRNTRAADLLRNPLISGVVSGMPSGILLAEMDSLESRGTLASREALNRAAYSSAIIGGFLGPINRYAPRLWTKSSKLPQPDGTFQTAPELGLTAEQLEVLTLAAPRLSNEARKQGVDPTTFIAGLNPKAFLRIRQSLLKDNALEEGSPEAEIEAPAAAVASIFGDRWRTWFQSTEALGAQRIDAASCLPLRAPGQTEGLADFLLERAQPEHTLGKHFDQSDMLTLMGTIAQRWSGVNARNRDLSMDELAFELIERMPRSEFLQSRDRLLRLTLRHSDAEGTTGAPNSPLGQGEIIASTANQTNAGSVNFKVEGTEATVSLLMVEPMYRRLGIAQLLMSSAEKSIPPEVTSVKLNVAAANTPALKLYESIGFRPAIDQTNKSVLTMVKPLKL